MPGAELFTVAPNQSEPKHGQLSKEQVAQYFEEGFLIVPNFFKKEELEPVLKGIENLVDILAEKLYQAGKIKEKHENATVFKRLTLIDNEFPGAAVLLHKFGVMIKIPRSEQVTVPWHQDNAYLSAEACDVLQPTAWIPLLDTNKENGCMEVARYGHRSGILAKHTCCAGPTWYVDLDENEMKTTLGVDMEKDVVLCEVPFGGVLFINNMVPHRSLNNYSENIRWSLDLRWQVPDKPNGFYGLKDSILLRTAKDPNHVVDWESFAPLDRTKLQDNYVNENTNIDKKEFVEDPEFDVTIGGPWMNRWEIVHHNKHTAAFKKNSAQSLPSR